MYAVAGINGHTGAAVANALLDAKQEVRAIVRRAEAGAQWKARGAEVAVADLTDPKALAAALSGAHGAYLLNPPRYEVPDPIAEAEKVGASVARALADSGIPRAVVLSSVGGHRATGTGIIRTVHRVEELLAGVATSIAFVRASYFFENWTPVLGAVREQGVLPTFFKSADYAVPTQPVCDIGAAVATLLTGKPWQGQRVIELSSFKASAADVAAAFSEVLGKTVSAVVVPHEQWADILRGAGFGPRAVELFVEMYDGLNSGVVSAEPGKEALNGKTTLEQAARALLSGVSR